MPRPPSMIEGTIPQRGVDQWSSKPDVLENELPVLTAEQAHRTSGCLPALGRTAWVEDLEAAVLFVKGEMAVAKHDGIGIRKA